MGRPLRDRERPVTLQPTTDRIEVRRNWDPQEGFRPRRDRLNAVFEFGIESLGRGSIAGSGSGFPRGQR